MARHKTASERSTKRMVARMYRAASVTLRLQFWGTVGCCVLAFSAHVFAQSATPVGLDDWLAPHNLFAFAGVIYGVGMLVAELYALRKRLEQAEKTYARVDVIDLHFASLRAELQSLRKIVEDDETGKRVDAFAARFEAFLQTVHAWTNAIEGQIHDTQKDVVRLETRRKP